MVERSGKIGRAARSILAAGAGLLMTLLGGAASAQDTANSAMFWIDEQSRAFRPRLAPNQQRIRRLMPHRQFARPTYWHERPSAPIYRPRPATRSTEPSVAALPRAVPKRAPEAVAPPTATPDVAQAAPVSAGAPFVVAVVGDSMALWLSTGLAEAYPPGEGVTVLAKGRDSSGLVRDDFYDWPKAVRDLVNGTRLDALVVMIGSNDRQPIRGPNGFEEPLSPKWEVLYGQRIDALVGLAKEKKIPVLWVGLPIMKSERYSQDIGLINGIERAHAEAAGAKFIDVFDAFADEKGQYSAFGPDVNGQIVKLRTGDGIHFTNPGARKLAHFVESELRHLRDDKEPTAAPGSEAVARAPENETKSEGSVPIPTTLPVAVAVPEKPAVGPVISLSAAPSSPGGDLLGRPGPDGRITEAQRARIETFRTDGAPPPR